MLPFLSCANWGSAGGAYLKWGGEGVPRWGLCCAKELVLSDWCLLITGALNWLRLQKPPGQKVKLNCPACWISTSWQMRQDEQGDDIAILWSWCLLLTFNVVSCKCVHLGLFKSLFSKEVTLHNLVDFFLMFKLNTQCTHHLHTTL